MITPDARTALERVSRAVATGASLGDLHVGDLQLVLRAADQAAGHPPRSSAPRVSNTAGGTTARVTTPHEDFGLCWWSSYDQRWVTETQGVVLLPDSALTIREVPGE